jgi:hypothetical protein
VRPVRSSHLHPQPVLPGHRERVGERSIRAVSLDCLVGRTVPAGWRRVMGHCGQRYEGCAGKSSPSPGMTDPPHGGPGSTPRRGVCLFADAIGFLFSAPMSALRPQEWAVLGAIAAAYAALALPARFSGWVAAAQAVVYAHRHGVVR